MRLAAALEPAVRRGFFTPAQWDRLCSLAEVDLLPTPVDLTTQESRAVLAHAEGLLTGWGCPPLTPAILDSCPEVKVIIHTGGSVRAFVGEEVYRRGILVTSQTALNAEPVAQFCLAHILLGAKGASQASRRYGAEKSLSTFEDGWATTGIGVRGATVALIGYGRVCHRLIEVLRPFGARVLLVTPYLDEASAQALGVELAPMEDAFATADVISLHLGDTPDNHGVICSRLLSLIKPGATFINTARGILVDEAALVGELLTGRFDAVLDVTWPEVPAPDSPLWTLPNVTLTPHWAGSLGRELTRLGQGAVDNVQEYLAGLPLTGRIDPTMAARIA
ncbi:MAG: hydroxyacid dehydrogenase [Propionibacteriaceae bacterium]|nr:hydroxyacid dehydrogenase [Propionibacteriaceae bacterium]